ncbi:MAG: histidinol-phosphatase [Clostridia bacterium]|nr:histidinol-phosphatase [Clostridia bacterium]
MLPIGNLHTHTCFCDGKDSPEEILREAIAQGLDTLGFSGHAYVEGDEECCMSPERTEEYRAEIGRLRALYGDRIHLLCGIERDYYSPLDRGGYDYVIGGVHYLRLDGELYPLDLRADVLRALIREHFAGDPVALARAYYERVAELPEKTECDVIAHFDLITKFNERDPVFDETDPRYLRVALDALDALLEQDKIIEINTGAVSRGYRRTPYPVPILLRRIAEKGGRVIFGSDSHSKETLLFGRSEAIHLARAAGIGSMTCLTPSGWQSYPI